MNDELYHYGHKGMKWGESIFTEEDRARGRAVREAQRQERQRKAQLEAQKHELLLKAKKEKEERAIKSGNPYAQDHATTRPNYVTKQELQEYKQAKKNDINGDQHKAHMAKVKEQIKETKPWDKLSKMYDIYDSDELDKKSENAINVDQLVKDNIKVAGDISKDYDDRKTHYNAAVELDKAQTDLAKKIYNTPESYDINDYRRLYENYSGGGVNDNMKVAFREASRYNDPGIWYINAYKEMCKQQGREVEQIHGGIFGGDLIAAKDSDHLPSGEEIRNELRTTVKGWTEDQNKYREQAKEEAAKSYPANSIYYKREVERLYKQYCKENKTPPRLSNTFQLVLQENSAGDKKTNSNPHTLHRRDDLKKKR